MIVRVRRAFQKIPHVKHFPHLPVKNNWLDLCKFLVIWCSHTAPTIAVQWDRDRKRALTREKRQMGWCKVSVRLPTCTQTSQKHCTANGKKKERALQRQRHTTAVSFTCNCEAPTSVKEMEERRRQIRETSDKVTLNAASSSLPDKTHSALDNEQESADKRCRRHTNTHTHSPNHKKELGHASSEIRDWTTIAIQWMASTQSFTISQFVATVVIKARNHEIEQRYVTKGARTGGKFPTNWVIDIHKSSNSRPRTCFQGTFPPKKSSLRAKNWLNRQTNKPNLFYLK